MLDDGLKDLEQLILYMEGLEQDVLRKREQSDFVVEVVADKQRQYDLIKKQHEDRVTAINRQARRQRGRRSLRGAGARVGDPTSAGDRRGEAAEAASRAEAQRAAQVPPRLDVTKLDQALGPARRRQLLGSEGGLDATSLTHMDHALQERLKLVRALGESVAALTRRAAALDLARPGSDTRGLGEERAALEVRVLSALSEQA